MKTIRSFTILKYINPTWYFNLFPENVNSFPVCYFNSSVMEISDEFSSLIKKDNRYTTKAAADLDTGFQAWNKGIMLEADNVSFDELIHEEKLSAEDNYIFTRKHYKWHFVFYLLAKNILSFNNPFTEINAFLKTRNIKKEDLTNPHSEYKDYDKFSSLLIDRQPLVSIIIPTFNRYEYLKDVLTDLENQDYKNLEIIIVDQTDNPDKGILQKYSLNLISIFQEGKGQWLARNEAIRKATGNYLLFFDDDSRVSSDWISQHLKGLEFFNADISAGVSISKVGDTVPAELQFFQMGRSV